MPDNDTNSNKDFSLVEIHIDNHDSAHDKHNRSYYGHGNQNDEQLSTQKNNKTEEEEEGSESIINSDTDFGNPTMAMEKNEEDCLRNTVFYLELKLQFLKMVATSALIILAVEWQPLQQLLQNVSHCFTILMVLAVISIAIYIVSLFRKIPKVLKSFLHILLLTHMLLFLANFSIFSVFSPYWIIFAAVIITTTYFFLGLLIYFHKTSFKGGHIYGFVTIVPLLFLILSQPFYFCVHVNSLTYYIFGPYTDYMINVCAGTGMALVFTLETVHLLKSYVKGLEFKEGVGVFSGSCAVLMVDQPDTPSSLPANVREDLDCENSQC